MYMNNIKVGGYLVYTQPNKSYSGIPLEIEEIIENKIWFKNDTYTLITDTTDWYYYDINPKLLSKNFKVGDKVICIDNTMSQRDLKLGNIYTICKTDKGYICIENPSILWNKNRFIPLPSSIIKPELPENLLHCHGYTFTCKISEKDCEGIITVEDDEVFLCQDREDGCDCKNKQGYKYSYTIHQGTKGNLYLNEVTDLQIFPPKSISKEDSKERSNSFEIGDTVYCISTNYKGFDYQKEITLHKDYLIIDIDREENSICIERDNDYGEGWFINTMFKKIEEKELINNKTNSYELQKSLREITVSKRSGKCVTISGRSKIAVAIRHS